MEESLKVLLQEAREMADGSGNQRSKLLDAMLIIAEKENNPVQQNIFDLLMSSYKNLEKKATSQLRILQIGILLIIGGIIFYFYTEGEHGKKLEVIEGIKNSNLPISLVSDENGTKSKLEFEGESFNSEIAGELIDDYQETILSIGVINHIAPEQKLSSSFKLVDNKKRLEISSKDDVLGYVQPTLKIYEVGKDSNSNGSVLEKLDTEEHYNFDYQDSDGRTMFYGRILNKVDVKYQNEETENRYKENPRLCFEEEIFPGSFEYTVEFSLDKEKWIGPFRFNNSSYGSKKVTFIVKDSNIDFPYVIDIGAGKACDNKIYFFNSKLHKAVVY
ncbi:hypothetical protein [Roseivirga sp.]|uniref:hypothetical protein n=1 Tax=Roseivirga sp. TaxID=1964215 RepID=UPI003B8D60C3